MADIMEKQDTQKAQEKSGTFSKLGKSFSAWLQESVEEVSEFGSGNFAENKPAVQTQQKPSQSSEFGKKPQTAETDLFGNPAPKPQAQQSFPSPFGSGSDMVINLEAAKLVRGEYQPRTEFDPNELQQLADSISKNGILQPIIVRKKLDGMYEIVAGERRWRAAQLAGKSEVPVIIKSLSDREVMEIALIENVQRKDLSPVEEAMAYRRLMGEFGYTQEELAQAVGKSRSYISNQMRLLSLPESVKNMLGDGKLTLSHARALVGVDKAEEIAGKIARGEITNVREVEEVAHIAKVEQKPYGKRKAKTLMKKYEKEAKDSDIISLEEMLARNLGIQKVNILTKGTKGEIRIKYKNLQELEKLLLKLNAA